MKMQALLMARHMSFVMAQDEGFDRFRIVKAVRMMAAAWLQDHLAKVGSLSFLISRGQAFAVFRPWNDIIGVSGNQDNR